MTRPTTIRLLDEATAWPIRRPKSAVAAAFAVLLLAVSGLLQVRIDPDVEGMLGGEAGQTYSELSRVFGWRERAFVLIESKKGRATGELVAAAEHLRGLLLQTPDCEAVEFGPPQADRAAGTIAFPHGLLLLQNLDAVRDILTTEGMRRRIERQIQRVSLPGFGNGEEILARDPLGIEEELGRRMESLRGGYRFAPTSPYFIDEDGRALLVVVRGRYDPVEAKSAMAPERFAATLETALDKARQRAPGLTFRGTGAAFVSAETTGIIRADLTWSLTASILLAAVLLAIGLGLGARTVLLLCLPTLWGSTVGAGLFAWLAGTVSGLSFACAAILVGLGIDFTIHVTTAALRERGRGRGALSATVRALRETRGRLALAAATSTAAFLAFLTSDAAFLRDMGLLTAIGLAACLVAPFLLLPAILLPFLKGKSVARATDPVPFRAMRGLAQAVSSRPKVTLALVAAATTAGAAVTFLRPPRIEDDLRNLHNAASPALRTQEDMSRLFEGSFEPVLLLVDGADEGDIIARCACIESAAVPLLDTGRLVALTSIADVVPSAHAQAATLRVLSEHDPAAVRARLRAVLDEFGFALEGGAFASYLDGFERAVGLRKPIDPSDLVAGNAAYAPLVERFVRSDRDRAYGLLVAQPAIDLWRGEDRRQLVDGLRGAAACAAPHAGLTGMLPTAVESADLVVGNFGRIAGLTLAAVVLVIALCFRAVRTTILVLVPASFGVLVSAVALSLCDVAVNIMNLGVLPMVLALGIDDGIHIVAHARSRRGQRSMDDVLESTGSGILLTSLTTMVTFGSLALSRSRGLASVGLVSFVGIGACLFASVVVLPCLLNRSAPR